VEKTIVRSVPMYLTSGSRRTTRTSKGVAKNDADLNTLIILQDSPIS
jgi:hypothetical protein